MITPTDSTSPAAPAPAAAGLDFLPRPLPQGLARLDDLGVIRAQGEDAASFLQGQLSNDVLLLKPGQSRLAAYCSPKGRVLASFIVYKAPAPPGGAAPELLLVCARDVLPATLKRLSMFVLRAKARLTDASAEFSLQGLAGAAPQTQALPDAPWSAIELEPGAAAIRLPPAAGLPRALLIAPASGEAPPLAAPALAWADWQWLDTLSGVPLLTAALADQLVPQMLNYESTGGVSFKKGCYPGQEVVARSQFRGTLKRRLYLVHAPVPLLAGQDVLHGPDPEDITGRVVQAAAVPGAEPARWVAAVSVQIAAAESPQGLHAAVQGQAPVPLTRIERPYELLEDI